MAKQRKELKKSKTLKRLLSISLIGALSLSLMGCTKRQIFIKETDPNQVAVLTQDELVLDNIYAKQGSYFYDLYNPIATSSNQASTVSSQRLIFYPKLDSFPKMYKDDFLVVASNTEITEPITIERYEDLGYSVGLYGGYVDSDGYLCFSVRDGMVEGSNIQLALENVTSDYIRICQINDEDVSANNLIAGGVIKGFEYGGQYKITYYAGTYKNSVTCYADTGIMRSYEIMETKAPEETDNTYTKFELPDDLKSGYYKCGSFGVMAYYDFEKGKEDTSKVDMNEPYYESQEEQFKAFSKKYAISIPEIKNNIRIEVSYNLGNYNIDDVKCVLTDPAGTAYDMTCEEDIAYVEISEMMPGTWNVNILPKDLEVIAVTPVATTPENDTVNDIEEFTFDEADSNIQFKCTYTGEGKIWGTVTQEETGEVKELVLDENTLSVTYPYLAAGTYKVTIYHYVDTAVEEITYGTDEDTQDVDLVIIN